MWVTPGGKVLAKLRARNNKAFVEDMRRIWATPHRREALAFRAPRAERWVEDKPVVPCLDEDLASVMTSIG